MNYLQALEKAILFIETHLTEPVRVEEIAGAAGYSYYHFHRVFEAVVGETVGSYLRARRLSGAANELIYSDRRIIDIACEYGFESQEAFNRAFKKMYRTTPAAYRKNRIQVMVGERKMLTPERLDHLQRSLTIKPEIRIIDPVCIVGIRGTTTLACNRIPDLWAQFNPLCGQIRDRTIPMHGYGICEVDPDFDMGSFNEHTEYSELVGVEVAGFKDIPAGMTARVLPGGKYAVFTHQGKLESLSLTYDHIWGTWIPCSGCELDLRDDFEFYDERFMGADHEQSEMDIYIPIK